MAAAAVVVQASHCGKSMAQLFFENPTLQGHTYDDDPTLVSLKTSTIFHDN